MFRLWTRLYFKALLSPKCIVLLVVFHMVEHAIVCDSEIRKLSRPKSKLVAGYPHMRWHAFLPLPKPANCNGCSFCHFVSFLLLCFSSFLLLSFFIFDHHETVNDSSGYDCRLQSVQIRPKQKMASSRLKSGETLTKI